MPETKQVSVKKRRFLSTDYDFIAEFIKKELQARKSLKERKQHEKLWKEVDRQVHMEAMAKLDANGQVDKSRSWESALELGDLSTAHEVLSADALRLIFPNDRNWINAHAHIDVERLNNRSIAAGEGPLAKDAISKLQKEADAELKALMTQQHTDFGLRSRIELSVKEALSHGSFVAEIQWEEMQQYSMGGVFKSLAAPVWVPHSMWNCYPETGELGVNLIYQGSMIIESEKSLEWVLRQTNFINQRKLELSITNRKEPVKLATYFGDLTVERKGDNVFLPNMKFIVANNTTVLFAQPQDNVTIVYGGYDRVDVRDPYFMSPIVKQSPNHKIATTIANKLIDNIDLKLDPTIFYDGSDPTFVANGGPGIFPGARHKTRGGAANIKQIDVGDPSWAINAIGFFKSETQEGTGVNTPRAGGERQADRVTATQIEEEAGNQEVRTIDFVGKVEKGIRSYLYISHELNKKKLNKYKFYNSEPGMPDFEILSKNDLPKDVHFEVVGSKGVLTERRRSEATSAVTAFLLSSELTQDIPNLTENARQMYMDAGNKNPEILMNIPDENDKLKVALEKQAEKFEEIIQELQGQLQQLSQDLAKAQMELVNQKDQLALRNERAEGTENALREQIRSLKGQMESQADFLKNIGKIKDEQEKLEDLIVQHKHQKELDAASRPETA